MLTCVVFRCKFYRAVNSQFTLSYVRDRQKSGETWVGGLLLSCFPRASTVSLQALKQLTVKIFLEHRVQCGVLTWKF